jgi:hypothetical protein
MSLTRDSILADPQQIIADLHLPSAELSGMSLLSATRLSDG